MLNQRIPDVTLQSEGSTGKMYFATEQRTKFLATLQRPSDCAGTSFQQTQVGYKKDFKMHFCKGLERTRPGDYFFIDVLHGVTKTPKSGHAVEGP